MSQNLSSAAVVIGALRFNFENNKHTKQKKNENNSQHGPRPGAV